MIKIEYGASMTETRGRRFDPAIKEALLRLKPGASFVVDDNAKRKRAMMMANRLGMETVTSRKLNGKGYRIGIPK